MTEGEQRLERIERQIERGEPVDPDDVAWLCRMLRMAVPLMRAHASEMWPEIVGAHLTASPSR